MLIITILKEKKTVNKNEAGALMDKRNVEWQEPE